MNNVNNIDKSNSLNDNLNRRNILKNSLFFGLGFGLLNSKGAFANSININTESLNSENIIPLSEFLKNKPPFSLPKLEYNYNALEPNIDALTMEIHYTKHHKAYIDNLNKAIENTEFANLNILDILSKLSGDKKQNATRNNAGGHFNHSFFWNILTPKQELSKPTGELLNQINQDFGSYEKFTVAFEGEAKSRFGSGWAWLIFDKSENKLKVTNTPNQDNTLMGFSEVKGIPIIGIDVWEHAYYLKYQNKRADYISAFWKVIDWKKAENNFISAK